MQMNIIVFVILFLVSPGSTKFDNGPLQEGDRCIEKSSSEWGSNCGSCYNSTNSYRVNIKNICSEPVDVKLAVQEKTSRWRIFNLNDLAPGDSLSGYACEGTGKYIFWSRNAGDKSVVFPTDEEIELEFSADK